MTARTSELLAKELDTLGLTTLAKLARQDMFHDYLSPHATPTMSLVDMLVGAAQGCPDGKRGKQILNLRQRVIDGDFDADEAESEEWAASPEGQATFAKLIEGK